jgi:DNA topoisomerase I
MVNDYIREITGDDFTAKDFRTWTGTVAALCALKEMGGFDSEKEGKQKILAALDRVSAQLGNTRTVCKKYYVHPSLLELYENNKLESVLKLNGSSDSKGLSEDERMLLSILKKI